MTSSAGRLWRLVARGLWLLWAMGSSSACGFSKYWEEPEYIQSLYGPPSVELPVGSMNYTPASPVHTGQTLTFTVEIPRGEIEQALVHAGTVFLGWRMVVLLDDGTAPDAVAADRIFTGQLVWESAFGTGVMQVSFWSHGTLDGSEAYGTGQFPALTVLP